MSDIPSLPVMDCLFLGPGLPPRSAGYILPSLRGQDQEVWDTLSHRPPKISLSWSLPEKA